MQAIKYFKEGVCMIEKSKSRKVFLFFNTIFVILISIICLVPIVNVLALSFSSSQAIIANKVSLWPVDFTMAAYKYVIANGKFWTSVVVTMKRVLLGVPLNIILVVLAAYPLSKSEIKFPARKYYVGFLLFAMVFNGGLIPTYYVVTKTGLMDTIWALIFPSAVNIFNVILVMNFFRGIPIELEESTTLDGANQWQVLTKIYLPLSKPSIATITLFNLIHHWNSWFDGLIYSNFTYHYPLQSYLQTVVTTSMNALLDGDIKQLMLMANINNTNMKAAQIFISIIPLLVVYPMLQKYFTTGLTLGSVKG